MRKSLLIQGLILTAIIIIIFFSYKFFFYESQNDEVKLFSKTNKLCNRAVIANHGSKDAFSTGSQNQKPPQPNS